jgi:hypothetical protein
MQFGAQDLLGPVQEPVGGAIALEREYQQSLAAASSRRHREPISLRCWRKLSVSMISARLDTVIPDG